MSSGFRHRTPDLGVLPFGSGLPAPRQFVDALQSLALTLRGRTLALVRTQLALVRRLLAIIRDSVALIGGTISFVGDPLTPRKFGHTSRESLLALIDLGSAPS